MGSSEATSGSAGARGRQVKEWLSTREVARRLEWSAKTIRRRCAMGSIPHTRIGDGPIRIHRSWVEEQERRAA